MIGRKNTWKVKIEMVNKVRFSGSLDVQVNSLTSLDIFMLQSCQEERQ